MCTSQEPIEKHGLTVGSWEVLSDDISDRQVGGTKAGERGVLTRERGGTGC